MAGEQEAAAISAPVLTQSKGDAGTVELPGAIFGEPLRRGLLADVVRMQMAGRRAGTSATKTRGEVSGGGKKPWKQKGTGRARAGSTRSPLWSGGATIFGPQPRDYGYTIPKQARRTALRSMLAQKLREARLTIVDRIEFPETKTKHFVAMLGTLGIGDSVLVVIDDADARVELAGRNVPNAKVLRAAGLNVYDLLRYHHLVITRAALERIKERVAA
ncbi:MAG: 50S ribosomal protein L4 [Polyangiaceae bacterium UTPRO1]|jgi:large subunit ribosomal protein L4|nr:50S ribosomal protein L4 [Myxococcales bacterium]OQY65879.1 MAG: 50S ribosomal protein L4 [Polyangiaceae bacterium UTPRO1]